MQVNLQNIKSQSEVLSVVVNGECNHSDVNIEQWDFGYPSLDINGEPGYVEDDRTVIVCTRCRCWCESIEDEWHGLSELPELPVETNRGEIIHDIQRMPF